MNNKLSIAKILRIIFRWPILFFLPLLISIFSLLIYVTGVEIFQSKSIVLFQSNYIPIEDHFTLLDKFKEQPVTIVRSLLYGDQVKKIVNEVWPETIDNEVLANSKIQNLRSRNGVKLQFQRDNPEALKVSYNSTSPKISYEVVANTVRALIDYNKELTEERLAQGIEFLNKELGNTREEIAKLESKIVRVRSGLPLSILNTQDAQNESIGEILDLIDIDIDIEGTLGNTLKFDDSISNLNYQLEIAKKELDQYQQEVKDKSYLDNSEDLEIVLNAGKDPEIQKITSLLFEKQGKLSELTSKGFLSAHPEVITLKKELENLELLKLKKLKLLQKKLPAESEGLTALRLEQLQNEKVENKQKQIERLKDRINATSAYQEKFKDKDMGLDSKLEELSERKAMLLELENKKLVASHSYAQMTKRLEIMKREGRIEQNKFGLSVQVAEAPEIPKNPIPFAGFPILVLGSSLTLAVLLGIATIMALLDNSIYSVSELYKLTGLKVIGTVDSFYMASNVEKKSYNFILIFIVGFILVSIFLFKFFDI